VGHGVVDRERPAGGQQMPGDRRAHSAGAEEPDALIPADEWSDHRLRRPVTLLLDNDDVRAVLSMRACIDALEAAFRDYALGRPTKLDRFARERDAIPVDSGREAIEGADVVALATNAYEPVLDASWLEPGQHVGSLQGHRLRPRLRGRGRAPEVASRRPGA